MLSYDFRQNKHVMETQQNMTVHKYTMDLQNSLVNWLIFCCSYETPSDETVVTLTINNIEETDDAEYLCEVVVGVNNKIKEKVDLRQEIQMDFWVIIISTHS